MSVGLIAVLAISLFNLALALLVFKSGKGRLSDSRKYFIFLLVAVALWSIVTFFEEESINNELIRVLVFFDFALASLIALFFYKFSTSFPRRIAKDDRYGRYYLIITITFFFLSFTPVFVRDVIFLPNGIKLISGPGYIFFVVYFFIFFISSIVQLFRHYGQSKGLEREQVKYVLIGLGVSGIIAAFTNLVLPRLIDGNEAVSRIGIYGLIIFNITTSYSILRHRLLDIRLVLTRSLIYGLLLTFVGLSFIFITFLSAQFFENTPTSRNVISFLVATLIVFGLDPLKRLLSTATDKIFFKASVDYQQTLKKLSEILSFELDLDKLIGRLEDVLQHDLKVKNAAILLRKGNGSGTEKFDARILLLRQNPNLSLRNDSGLVTFLREHKHFSLVESLERKIEDTPEEKRGPLVESKQEFDRIGAGLVAPIFAQGHLIAIMTLGPKLSGDTFSNDDIQLIEVLGPQIGSAIQKANLFDEVRRFSEGLRIKVDEATAELQEKNVSLVTLQKITRDVTRTLDFNNAVQNIANAVATELGYIGAILAFLDEDGKTSRARAITSTPITEKAIKILPKHFSEYSTDITDPKHRNLATEVYETGEIRMSNNFTEVVAPPLPKILALTVQKLVGIKCMVIVPIVSEEKVIGVIEIGLRKDQSEISKREIETMQSVADQLGVVSRNLRLFDQLKKTNLQLEEANKHLQQLDQAKSEFVSIASHQLRTPMTGIKGYLSMMTQGDFGRIAPEHLKILNDLLAESERMIRLINQFLNVSKIEAGKFTYAQNEVQLEDLIEREVKELNKAAKDKGLKLVWKAPKKKLPVVIADADKLQDVILNLIDNAIKYTAEGSVTVGVEQVGDQMHFFVKDTGIGIKPGDATELFNKFVRGSGIAQIHPDGSGLGLFIAKSIIDAHGGRIWVSSDGEGKGSTFQFTIPLYPLKNLHAASAMVKS